jgi:hypothetical protein
LESASIQGNPGDTIVPDESMKAAMAARHFNEKENKRRAEREAYEKQQQEQRMRMQAISERQRAQKYSEQLENQLNAEAKNIINGEHFHCAQCGASLSLAIRCANYHCACINVGVEPIIRRIIKILKEEKHSNSSSRSSTKKSQKGKKRNDT